MSRDEIIRMARETGLIRTNAAIDCIERFAALVAAAEREACAKAYEHFVSSGENDDAWAITRDLALRAAADVIRARGQG